MTRPALEYETPPVDASAVVLGDDGSVRLRGDPVGFKAALRRTTWREAASFVGAVLTVRTVMRLDVALAVVGQVLADHSGLRGLGRDVAGAFTQAGLTFVLFALITAWVKGRQRWDVLAADGVLTVNPDRTALLGGRRRYPARDVERVEVAEHQGRPHHVVAHLRRPWWRTREVTLLVADPPTLAAAADALNGWLAAGRG